jgi:hypothetical protein
MGQTPQNFVRTHQLVPACNIPEFPRNVSNAKMWISKFLNEIECLIKL